MTGPKMFDIRNVTVNIKPDASCSKYSGTFTVSGIGTDGFTVTPEVEHSMLEGLQSTIGYNIDPSEAATITLNLKSTSETNNTLNGLFNVGGEPCVFSFEIVVDEGKEETFGYSSIVVDHCIVQKPAEISTNEKEAPEYEWTIIGYGYTMNKTSE